MRGDGRAGTHKDAVCGLAYSGCRDRTMDIVFVVIALWHFGREEI